jgi:hypothetical protein
MRTTNSTLPPPGGGFILQASSSSASRSIRKAVEINCVAASRLDASEDVLAALTAAKRETQFSKSVGLVKDAIPQALLVHGHNPLTMLHTALSDGLHDRSDEHCLELAHDIRVVLADLAERIGQVLKDHAELKASVTRLLNRDPK